jgi:hypothetical protein
MKTVRKNQTKILAIERHRKNEQNRRRVPSTGSYLRQPWKELVNFRDRELEITTKARCRWLTPIIPTTQEAEIRRIVI